MDTNYSGDIGQLVLNYINELFIRDYSNATEEQLVNDLFIPFRKEEWNITLSNSIDLGGALNDNYNCGVMVCLYMKLIMLEYPLNVIKSKNANQYRQMMSNELLVGLINI